MKRETVLKATLAVGVLVLTSGSALGMRDPGARGMYGPIPPRVGMGGPGGQYSDGMNLYQYGRSAPVSGMDPNGELVIYAEGAVAKISGMRAMSTSNIWIPLRKWAFDNNQDFRIYEHRNHEWDPLCLFGGAWNDQKMRLFFTLADESAGNMFLSLYAADSYN